MKNSLVENIANAVLYEGYLLYPYRPSAVKNQQRWNFGALCPEPYSRAQAGTESWTMRTECLIESNPNTVVNVKVRFLHLLIREVARVVTVCRLPIVDCGHRQIPSMGATHFEMVPGLEVNGHLYQRLQEVVERNVCLPVADFDQMDGNPIRLKFSFPPTEMIEALRDESSGENIGVLVRRQQEIDGIVEVRLEHCAPVEKISVQILNLTPLEDADKKSRDEALTRSFVSTHTILTAENGQFVSLIDPPDPFQEAAAACSNVGTYPVLVGEEGDRDCMLSAPIILYDYPQIAPESAGNLFDGTEIDEILTLRIMTLTEDEKREMRDSDDRARQILERTETLPVEQLMKMHGAMKGLKR
jgi:hypothetical protein